MSQQPRGEKDEEKHRGMLEAGGRKSNEERVAEGRAKSEFRDQKSETRIADRTSGPLSMLSREGARIADGVGAAVHLCQSDQQGVVFVVESRASR